MPLDGLPCAVPPVMRGPASGHADVLMVVPVVCPLVLTTGFGAGAGAGAGAWAAFSDGLSMTGLASAWRAGGGAGTLFDETAFTAMGHLA